MKPDPQQHLPLSPATLHVLLALASGDLHGYAIMQEVARHSGGQYKIGPPPASSKSSLKPPTTPAPAAPIASPASAAPSSRPKPAASPASCARPAEL
jgi:hypothetical protein